MNNDFKDIFDVKELGKNPFQVPDGYFDSLESRIMRNVSQQEKKEDSRQPSKWSRIVSMRPMRWAAACIGVTAVCATAYFCNIDNSEGMMSNTSETQTESTLNYNSNDAFNQAADYTMLDSHDMYMMLADESY